MRLTLRTLLAHLDKTLEADDDAAIAAKLQDSEFASNLVRRISACIAGSEIGAPSPVSTSTVDDPNRIGEYLDSVLPAEQVAEIERICLESDGHLAEVAACHQILTIVLGNPAEIPSALRSRIHELAQPGGSVNASWAHANGNPTDLSHRASAPQRAVGSSDAITQAMAADASSPAYATLSSASVIPVGPDDSGVSDAPTRLREAALAKSNSGHRDVAMAGSRPINAAEASELFGRPSRVVPWLVSLALIAAFLFVAVQAFAPLLRKRAAVEGDALAQMSRDTGDAAGESQASGQQQVIASGDSSAPRVVPEVDASVAPPLIELDPVPALPPANTNPLAGSPTSGMASGENDELPVPMPEAKAGNATQDTTARTPAPVPPQTNGSPAGSPTGRSAAPTTSPAESEPSEPAASDVAPPLTEVLPGPDMAAPDGSGTDAPPSDMPTGDESQMVLRDTALVSDGSLLLVRKPTEASYLLANKDDPITNRSDLLCPPLYRSRLSLLGTFDMTMVGPTKLLVESGPGELPIIQMSTGRLLLSSMVRAPAGPSEDAFEDLPLQTSDKSIRISFGGADHGLHFQESDAQAALEVNHLRSPGADPEDEQSITPVMEILAIRGTILWETDGAQPVTINTGEVVRWSPPANSAKTLQSIVPPWIDLPPPAPGAMESSARDGLFTLVRADESIELSLREAISFRRAEVGSLAAQSLVLLDRPSVYFGAGGIFTDVKQKAYWPDHFNTLVAAIDRGPESAAVVRQAIDQMDAAEATAIYRLLWLFSDAQLQAGSDELLVSSLDHANMTVRVLAAENLRRITGTTLFFKPENETAPRRSGDIKKWETRLRKGDIRWPAP